MFWYPPLSARYAYTERCLIILAWHAHEHKNNLVSNLPRWILIIAIIGACIYSGVSKAIPEVKVVAQQEAINNSFAHCDMELDYLKKQAFDITQSKLEDFDDPTFVLYDDYPWIHWGRAYAVYFDDDNTIHLNTRALETMGTLDACSVIVHEFVHAIQNQEGRNTKAELQKREGEAYHVQSVFISNHFAEYLNADQGRGVHGIDNFKRLQIALAQSAGHDLEGKEPILCIGYKNTQAKTCLWIE